jgi:hypothetical protein
MRDLMRDVMIRNTSALVDVRLPPRHAATLRLDPDPEEAACYRELSRLAAGLHATEPARHRLALKSLLSTAGSSPFAAAAAVYRFAAAIEPGPEWLDLCDQYATFEALGDAPLVLERLVHRDLLDPPVERPGDVVAGVRRLGMVLFVQLGMPVRPEPEEPRFGLGQGRDGPLAEIEDRLLVGLEEGVHLVLELVLELLPDVGERRVVAALVAVGGVRP